MSRLGSVRKDVDLITTSFEHYSSHSIDRFKEICYKKFLSRFMCQFWYHFLITFHAKEQLFLSGSCVIEVC